MSGPKTVWPVIMSGDQAAVILSPDIMSPCTLRDVIFYLISYKSSLGVLSLQTISILFRERSRLSPQVELVE